MGTSLRCCVQHATSIVLFVTFIGGLLDRVIAAKWIKKLSRITKSPITVNKLDAQQNIEKVEIAGDDKLQLRNDYLKLLLLILQKKKMFGFFENAPEINQELNEYPVNKYSDMLKEFSKNATAKDGGDVADYEVASNSKEYAVVQKIPHFGIHCYYAVSYAEPVNEWIRAENAILPGISPTTETRWFLRPLEEDSRVEVSCPDEKYQTEQELPRERYETEDETLIRSLNSTGIESFLMMEEMAEQGNLPAAPEEKRILEEPLTTEQEDRLSRIIANANSERRPVVEESPRQRRRSYTPQGILEMTQERNMEDVKSNESSPRSKRMQELLKTNTPKTKGKSRISFQFEKQTERAIPKRSTTPNQSAPRHPSESTHFEDFHTDDVVDSADYVDDYSLNETPPIFRQSGSSHSILYSPELFGLTADEHWEIDAGKRLDIDRRFDEALRRIDDSQDNFTHRLRTQQAREEVFLPDVKPELNETLDSFSEVERLYEQEPLFFELLLRQPLRGDPVDPITAEVGPSDTVFPRMDFPGPVKTVEEYQRELGEIAERRFIHSTIPPIESLVPHRTWAGAFESKLVEEHKLPDSQPLTSQQPLYGDVLQLPYYLDRMERERVYDNFLEGLGSEFLDNIKLEDVEEPISLDAYERSPTEDDLDISNEIYKNIPDSYDEFNISEPRRVTQFVDRPPPVRRYSAGQKIFDEIPQFTQRRSTYPDILRHPKFPLNISPLPARDDLMDLDDVQMDLDSTMFSDTPEPLIERDPNDPDKYRIPSLVHVIDPERRFRIMQDYYRRNIREFPAPRAPPGRRQSFDEKRPVFTGSTGARRGSSPGLVARAPSPTPQIRRKKISTSPATTRLQRLRQMTERIAAGRNQTLPPLAPQFSDDPATRLEQLQRFREQIASSGRIEPVLLPPPIVLPEVVVEMPEVKLPPPETSDSTEPAEDNEERYQELNTRREENLLKMTTIQVEGVEADGKFILTGGMRLGPSLYIYPNGIAIYAKNEDNIFGIISLYLDANEVRSGEHVRHAGFAINGRLMWFYPQFETDEYGQVYDPRPVSYELPRELELQTDPEQELSFAADTSMGLLSDITAAEELNLTLPRFETSYEEEPEPTFEYNFDGDFRENSPSPPVVRRRRHVFVPNLSNTTPEEEIIFGNSEWLNNTSELPNATVRRR